MAYVFTVVIAFNCRGQNHVCDIAIDVSQCHVQNTFIKLRHEPEILDS